MTKDARSYAFLACFFMLLFATAGCAVKKKKAKDSSFTANITTKFNILFNIERLLQEAEANTDELIKDNYQSFITVFKEPNTYSIEQNNILLDSIKAKTSRIIDQKQDSKYVNLAFLFKAKAHYLQGDYFSANELFSYVYHYAEEEPKLQYEALLWQIRTLIQLDNINTAADLLNLAKDQVEEHKAIASLFYATRTKLNLRQNRNSDSIDDLTQAVELTRNKSERNRWRYLLAQLLFAEGKDEVADSLFSKIVRSNESYEMVFHSNLYKVEIENHEHPSIEKKVNLLSKLLKDSKNKDFKGQIYQHIGDTYFNNKNLDQAIAYYQKASYNTINDSYQQAINYQKLADIYFNEGQYPKSTLYYDSTLLVLPQDHPRYQELSRKQTHLDALVNHLTTISHQDSLLMLAAMSPEERESALTEILALNRDSGLSNVKSNNEPNSGGSSRSKLSFQMKTDEDPSFYFNSTIALNQGYSDFKRRWGNRPNTGHWRYSHQADYPSTADHEVAVLHAEGELLENTTKSYYEEYLSRIPQTEEEISAAENLIKNAYLSLAEIYQYDLKDIPAAINAYENYLQRFQIDDSRAVIYFHLYRLHESHSPERQNHFKDRLSKEFPTSKYNLAINDPDYYKNQQDLLLEFNQLYNQAYELFQSSSYQKLIILADTSLKNTRFETLENHLAQLSYLRALSIGRTADIDQFKASLEDLIDKFPEEQIVIPLVQQHLSYINNHESQYKDRAIALDDIDQDESHFRQDFALTPWPQLALSKEYEVQVTRRDYNVDVETRAPLLQKNIEERTVLGNKNIEIGEVSMLGHENSYRDQKLFPDSANYYFVINVMHGSVNLSPSRYGIGQFNRGQYPGVAITHHVKNIDNENQLIYIGVFSSFDEAKAYEKKISPMLSNIMKIPQGIYTSFLITEAVFNTFANSEHIEDYDTLYRSQK